VDIGLNLAIFSQQIIIHNRSNICRGITVLVDLVSEVCPPRSAIEPGSEAPSPPPGGGSRNLDNLAARFLAVIFHLVTCSRQADRYQLGELTTLI
jgi:hypothetical protein